MSDITIFFALVVIAAGALLWWAGKRDGQQPLGGAVVLAGLVIGTGGLFLRLLGQ